MSVWNLFIRSVMTHFRGRRNRFLIETFPGMRDMKVLDIGGSRHFWEIFPVEHLPNDLTLLNISDDHQSLSLSGKDGGPNFSIVLYDGRTIPFPDRSFDLVVCNSVIEHVPPAGRDSFISELRRVAASYVVQTPAREFPIEPHFVMPFVHWLPRSVGRRMAWLGIWALLNRPNARQLHEYFDEVHLLNVDEFMRYFPDGTYCPERFLGLSKSHISLRLVECPFENGLA